MFRANLSDSKQISEKQWPHTSMTILSPDLVYLHEYYMIKGRSSKMIYFSHSEVNRSYKFKNNSISSRMQRNCEDEPDHTEHNAYFGRGREIPLEMQFKHVSTYAYNCTRNETTGYSPYYLMSGREPQSPINLILDNPESPVQKNHTDYFLNQWEKSMSEAYKIAAKNAEQRKAKYHARDNIPETQW